VSAAILVTGGGGRLGRALKSAGAEAVVALPRAALDARSAASVAAAFAAHQPRLVIHCAAFTNVDKCELEPDHAWAGNAASAACVAQACAATGAALIHISTDFVFAGARDRPYTEEDPIEPPISVYAASKIEGEKLVAASGARACIARVAWLCGDEADFPTRMFEIGMKRGAVRVADDEIGSPTPIAALAARLLKLADLMLANAHAPPILHLSGTPPVCRHDWVKSAFESARALGVETPLLHAGKGADFNLPARRPHFSALDVGLSERLLGPAPDWRIGLGARLKAAAQGLA
jgi:dTDP-4-dehydrorhamnose reductase